MDKGGGPTQDLLDMGGKDVSNKSNEVSFPNSGKAKVVVAFQKLLTKLFFTIIALGDGRVQLRPNVFDDDD